MSRFPGRLAQSSLSLRQLVLRVFEVAPSCRPLAGGMSSGISVRIHRGITGFSGVCPYSRLGSGLG
jgi:hypothetical protein